MNLKLVCPKCGAKHNPNSTHSMNASDFIEGDIRTIMEERGWCFQCACWQNIYNVHKDNPGWVRIDGVSWIIKPMAAIVPGGWNALGCGGRKMYINIEGKALLHQITAGAKVMFRMHLRI